MNGNAQWWSGGGPGHDELDYIQILHLEDSRDDAALLRSALEHGGLRTAITLVMSRSEFEIALESERFDLILCDHNVPGYDGFAALEFARQQQPQVPVIMLTGQLDDAQAVQSLKSGAADYILKGREARLVPAIRRALAEAREAIKQAAAEDRLRQQARLLDLTRDAILVQSMEDRIVYWNAGAAALFGWSSNNALGQNLSELLQGDAAQLDTAKRRLLQSGDWMGELQLRGKSGGEIRVLSRWNLLRDKEGQPEAVLSTNMDITERKKLEAALLRAQRMDSIGALASGIAHDLGNAMAPILVSANLLESCGDPDVRGKARLIHANAQRASGLVKHILGFVRGHGGQVWPVALADLVQEVERLARNTFPKSVHIAVHLPDAELWKTQGDPTELHQVILNLCLNARDAMPAGGLLTMGVQNARLDPVEAAALGGQPGPHVMVSVADTGQGIPPGNLPHIFEPFFTTKPPQLGTGLGLSTVEGIVARHGGCIELKTEVGKGSEFRIYLPATEEAAADAADPEKAPPPSGHGELILVVEDEQAMLELTKETLESYGYQVVTAQTGRQGIARFEESGEKISLMVTDTLGAPMSGLEAARAIRKLRPDLPVIVASASQQDPAESRQMETGPLTRLEKPYNLEQLLVAVANGLHH